MEIKASQQGIFVTSNDDRLLSNWILIRSNPDFMLSVKLVRFGFGEEITISSYDIEKFEFEKRISNTHYAFYFDRMLFDVLYLVGPDGNIPVVHNVIFYLNQKIVCNWGFNDEGTDLAGFKFTPVCKENCVLVSA